MAEDLLFLVFIFVVKLNWYFQFSKAVFKCLSKKKIPK